MKIGEDKIKEHVQKQYDYLIKKYSKLNILGVFVVGIANYGFAESIDDIVCIGIYLPNFEELCTKIMNNKIEKDTMLIDIRSIYNCLDMCKWGALELLYSDYSVINPAYENLFIKHFINNREEIGNYDKYERINICYQRALNSLEKGNYFEAARLRIVSNLYLNGVKGEDIFHLKKDYYVDYLWEIKKGTRQIDKAEIINDFLSMLENTINSNIESNKETVSNKVKQGIISIMASVLQKKVSINIFYDGLSKTEKDAMKEVLNRLDENGIGNISISKIVEETGISRPVYKNLFVKLEKDKVATITNHGAKGTHISFDMSLFN